MPIITIKNNIAYLYDDTILEQAQLQGPGETWCFINYIDDCRKRQSLKPILIHYYEDTHYGQTREFVDPQDQAKNNILITLLGRHTLTPQIRRLITELTSNHIQFIKVPKI